MSLSRTVPADCPLTARQFLVLCELADGRTGKQVALRLGISESTIRSHVHEAYRRLGVTGHKQAVAHLLRQGWLGWFPPRPESPKPQSHFQRAYLQAFDEFLQTQGTQARRAMRIALYGARNEAGLEPNMEYRPGPDPVDRIMQAMFNVGRSGR